MNAPDKCLYEFIKEQHADNDYGIIQYGIPNLLPNFLNLKPNKMLNVSNRAMQQYRSNVMWNELKNISKELVNTDVKLIVVKGVAFEDFYKGAAFRRYGDIDLFIQEKDVSFWINLLNKNGYELQNIDMSNDIYNGDDHYIIDAGADTYVKHQLEICHLTFFKIIDGKILDIELHSNLLGGRRYSKINNQDIYDRSYPIVKNNVRFFEVECNDMLIYLICHLCKHISRDVFLNMKKHNISIQQLHDIAQILYQHHFDWEVVAYRVEEWQVMADFVLASKVLNYIYANYVPNALISYFEQQLNLDTSRNTYSTIIKDIATQCPENIFYMNFEKYLKTQMIDINFPVLPVYRQNNERNIFSVYNKEGIDGYVTWDEFKISFNLLLSDPNYVEGMSAVLLTILNNKGICPANDYVLRIINNSLKIFTIKQQEVNSCSIWAEDIFIDKMKYGFKLNILWEFLDISPHNEALIPFNIKLFKVDEKGGITKTALSKHNHFNYYNIPAMQLKMCNNINV